MGADQPKTLKAALARIQVLETKLQDVRHAFKQTEALLAASELAVSVYTRAATIAQQDAEEQRRRRLAIEEEFQFGYNQRPWPP